jgi:hypothetical protein
VVAGAGVVIVTVGSVGLEEFDPHAATPAAAPAPSRSAPIAVIILMPRGYSRPRTPSLRENARR